ncbi:MAG: copper amine oxidase N-terminal domain-containing protein [Clostridiales bacterium]|nr:copper amine oxidase N-terminal domain-containing protein [Clostridiales bacterium]
MNKRFTRIYSLLLVFLLFFAFTAGIGIVNPSLPAIAAEPDPYNSTVYLIVDTALADSRDYVEMEVVLVGTGGGLVANRSVFCASSRKEDSVSVRGNSDGLVNVSISSSLPGVSQVAFSLVSSDAASRYLRGEISYSDAKIVQTSDGLDTFSVYFIAGSLDIEACEIEFDKDTIAVTDYRYSDVAIGTVSLRTEIDQPVANQRVTVYSNHNGILLYPASSSSANFGEGASITLTTDRDGRASFVVKGYQTGDAEIICRVGSEEFSEFLYIDIAENVFDFEEPYQEDEEEEEEEETPVISRAHTKVRISKPIAYEYGSNGRYNLPVTEDGWDKILIGGIAMSADEEPIREQHLVRAYTTAGSLDKTETLTTSLGGAFSFGLSSKDICMGRYAIGLGTVEQLKAYLEGRLSAEGCQLLDTGSFSFISHDWNQYIICTIGEQKAIINHQEALLDVAPFIRDGRTMLTARPIADTIGAVANWNQARQTASFYAPIGNYTISMKVGSTTIDRTETFVAPRQYHSDVPAMIVEGRTVLPLRALGEAFNMRTIYDDSSKMVAVYNTRVVPYDPRLDPDSLLYDPTMDPDSDEYIERY